MGVEKSGSLGVGQPADGPGGFAGSNHRRPHPGASRHPFPNDWERGTERGERTGERCAVAVGIGPLRGDREGLGVTGVSNRVVDDVLTGTGWYGALPRSRSPTRSRPLASQDSGEIGEVDGRGVTFGREQGAASSAPTRWGAGGRGMCATVTEWLAIGRTLCASYRSCP